MKEAAKSASQRASWLLPAFLIGLVICGLLPFASSPFIIFATSFAEPRGTLSDSTEWPKPLAAVFGENDIEVYRLSRLPDERAIAQVYGHDDLIATLVETHALQETDSSHPLAPNIKRVLPDMWNEWKETKDDQWFTSNDFGRYIWRDEIYSCWSPMLRLVEP